MYSRQIESFIEVANAGSFSKAARALYIAPSSLIQQIDLLERRLGVVLFERGRRGVALTEAGTSLYRDAVDIVRRADAAVARARSIQNGVDQSIRIGTSLLTKCRMLPTFWAHMIERYPDTRIELVALDEPSKALERPLVNLGKTFDLQEGLYLSERYRGRCRFLELMRCPLVPAIPEAHPLAGKAALSLSDLAGTTVVLLERGLSRDFDALRNSLEADGAVRIVDVPFYDMNVFSACEMENRILMTPSIWEDIHPALKVHAWEGAEGEEGSAPTCPYGIIYTSDPTPQTQRFLDVIKEVKG
ncbi:MAG: LysR family transcriptional regulator [Eggerthellaceae bacterium]|nr:LysR family transcriptional regulator [Eggerthellaceae bacterium]